MKHFISVLNYVLLTFSIIKAVHSSVFGDISLYPTHARKVRLYSRQGLFLAIYGNGKIGGTSDRSSKDGETILSFLFFINLSVC